MKGKFYAVGIGPGDPELLTVKAVNIMKRSDIIAVPMSGSRENAALKIAERYIEGKEVLEYDMPMTKDTAKLEECHETATRVIAELLEKGRDVAFLTLGDPAIYSTVMYVHRLLTERGYDTAMIPGITSFCGAAASLNVPLCERDEILHIVPATYRGSMGQLNGVRVLMKSGKNIGLIRDELAGENAMMVECATMPDEKIYLDMRDVGEESSYFSLIIVPEKKIKENEL